MMHGRKTSKCIQRHSNYRTIFIRLTSRRTIPNVSNLRLNANFKTYKSWNNFFFNAQQIFLAGMRAQCEVGGGRILRAITQATGLSFGGRSRSSDGVLISIEAVSIHVSSWTDHMYTPHLPESNCCIQSGSVYLSHHHCGSSFIWNTELTFMQYTHQITIYPPEFLT